MTFENERAKDEVTRIICPEQQILKKVFYILQTEAIVETPEKIVVKNFFKEFLENKNPSFDSIIHEKAQDRLIRFLKIHKDILEYVDWKISIETLTQENEIVVARILTSTKVLKNVPRGGSVNIYPVKKGMETIEKKEIWTFWFDEEKLTLIERMVDLFGLFAGYGILDTMVDRETGMKLKDYLNKIKMEGLLS